MDEDWIDVLYDKLIKVEDSSNGYGLATFLVWHEAYGYFKVTEEIESDNEEDAYTYYKNNLEGTGYDWIKRTEEEWGLLYESKEFEFVSLD